MPWPLALPRRRFLQLTASAAASLAHPTFALAPLRSVQIILNPADPIASAAAAMWAAHHLQLTLADQRIEAQIISAVDLTKSPGHIVFMSGPGFTPPGLSEHESATMHPESVRLTPFRAGQASGSWVFSPGVLGLVYGLTDLADRVTCSSDPFQALALSVPLEEKPANEVRSVARAFCSEVEDKPWYYSKEFWTGYLDALVTSRFNRFNLAFGFGYDFPKGVSEDYFHFPYPYLVTVPGYDVRVLPLAAGERERNFDMLRYIAAETAARGLQFQLGIWTHAYEWTESPKARHHIEGITPKNHASYCRDALAIILKECPQITGLTLRVHGESGVPEGSYDFWRTLFQAIQNCGRSIEIDMHAKGINQIMIDMANATGMPVKIGAKSWAEHMGMGYHQADIREMEIPRPERMESGVFNVSNGERRFTRYGYADLFQEDRRYNVLFRLWPGTQRHLLWGDPEMAAAYSRTAHFCGAAGLEVCEPLTFKGREGSGHQGGRCAYTDPTLSPQFDWAKFSYTYRLWGRLLYNPETSAEVWRRSLTRQFGSSASAAETSLANASRVLPLFTTAHLPSASNHSFWPELYTNMPITPDQHSPYSDTPKPYRFGTVSPLDPQLFSSITEFVADELTLRSSPKYSPLTVASWLDGFTSASAHSLDQLRNISMRKTSAELTRWEEDIQIQIALGRFFSAKLRSGVAFEIFLQTGDQGAGQAALTAYTGGRDIWAAMTARASGIYKADIDYGEIPMRRGHWADRLPAIDADIDAMRLALNERPGAKDPPGLKKLIPKVDSMPPRLGFTAQHTPASVFSPGKPLELALRAGDEIASVELFYRHVNQGERWRSAPMAKSAASFVYSIPAAYTQSPYPLQYYFVLRNEGAAGFHPEFNAELSNQPYFALWRRS